MRFPLHLPFLLLVGVVCGCADPATAGWELKGPIEKITVSGEMLGGENISGGASVGDGHLLIGSDEGRFVQTARIDAKKRNLEVTSTIPLLDDSDDDSIDIEGVAASVERSVFYISASHGVTRENSKPKKERYKVFRLPFDKKTGKAEPDSLKEGSIKGLLRKDSVLKNYFEKPLPQMGINIEGLAEKNGKLFFGFRAPSIKGEAFVLETVGDALFRKGKDRYKLHRVPLGDGLGIREIASTRHGFLIIAGNSGVEPTSAYPTAVNYQKQRGYTLYLWNPEKSGDAKGLLKIGVVPAPRGRAEGLIVLEESDTAIDFAILYDGVRNGRPWHFRIVKNS